MSSAVSASSMVVSPSQAFDLTQTFLPISPSRAKQTTPCTNRRVVSRYRNLAVATLPKNQQCQNIDDVFERQLVIQTPTSAMRCQPLTPIMAHVATPDTAAARKFIWGAVAAQESPSPSVPPVGSAGSPQMKCQLRRIGSGLVLEEDPDWDEKKVVPARDNWLKARRLLRAAGLDASKVTLVQSSQAYSTEENRETIRSRWKRATAQVITVRREAFMMPKKTESEATVYPSGTESDSKEKQNSSTSCSGSNDVLDKPLSEHPCLKLPKIQKVIAMAPLHASHDGDDVSKGGKSSRKSSKSSVGSSRTVHDSGEMCHAGEDMFKAGKRFGTSSRKLSKSSVGSSNPDHDVRSMSASTSTRAPSSRKLSKSSVGSSNSDHDCGDMSAVTSHAAPSSRKSSKSSVGSSNVGYDCGNMSMNVRNSVSSRASTSRSSSLASSSAGTNQNVAQPGGAASLRKNPSHDGLCLPSLHTSSASDHVSALTSCETCSQSLSPHGIRYIAREMNSLSNKSQELFSKAKARFGGRRARSIDAQ
eukprot:gnl/MRDRNA2_/MRDRNA2_93346_c0_seq1.p1 gnl/MRDRNA2_/MRDRNA2_93346_c0~~gnl/MRDRNA2_/MRDRNA2_93346_c0_seq1.p1  ORF type:complete len:531 (+),score=82.08 gnl/MRDRNA2_/MRDRNA2_93346_c0_seq1:67-1659(+)